MISRFGISSAAAMWLGRLNFLYLRPQTMLNGLTLYIEESTLTPVTEVSLIPLKLTQHDSLHLTVVATDSMRY